MGIHPRSVPNFGRRQTSRARYLSRPSLCSNSGTVSRKVRDEILIRSDSMLFFAGPIPPLSFEDQDAEIAGAIRADLESIGKPIGAYDLLIAGQAIRNNLTLITANLRDLLESKN